MAKNTYKQDEVLEEPFDIKHLLRASSYIKKYAKRMVFAILLSGIGGASGYVAPMIIQRALDLAIPEKNERLLFSLVGMLVGIYLVSVIFTTIRSRIMVDVSQSIIYDIRKDLFAHLQELPFQYYDDRPHGKILIRVVNYVNSVSDMLSNGLINIVLESFNLLFIVIFMFLVDVQMAFVVLCGVPVLCVFMVWIKNKQRRAWQAVSNTLIVKVVVSKNIYFLFFQVIRYCSVPDVSINKLSTFIGNHVRHRIQSDYHHFE